MANPSFEQLLLVVETVRVGDQTGTFCMMGERIGLMPVGENNFSISLPYADILNYYITLGVGDVALQTELKNGQITDFYFDEMESAIADRAGVCVLLGDMKKQFK